MAKLVKNFPVSIAVFTVSLILVVAAVFLIRLFFFKKPAEIPVEPKKSLARIVHFQGTVKIKAAERIDWKDAENGQVLSKNDKVKTWSGSAASIEFENGSLINLKENSLIVIQELMSNDTSVEVLSGRISAQVEELDPDQTFRIRAKFAEARVMHKEQSSD
jgi:hypothetical protein